MNDLSPLCRIAHWSTVLFLGVLAVGCDNGDGGPTTLHFRNSNWDSCRELTVDVNLEEAGAVLARKSDGSIDCKLPPGGICDVEFEEIDGVLKVTMDCRVDAENLLFECAFSQSDARAITDATTAYCACSREPVCDWNSSYCDEFPAICASTNADIGACEDCYNEVDDDGNGKIDCEDPNCAIEDCGFGGRSSSTVTCPSSTSTTVEFADVDMSTIQPSPRP